MCCVSSCRVVSSYRRLVGLAEPQSVCIAAERWKDTAMIFLTSVSFGCCWHYFLDSDIRQFGFCRERAEYDTVVLDH